MVLPISCNECRRRKIRCNRIQPCKNCITRCVECTYPAKFRSIDLHKLTPTQDREFVAPFTLPQAYSNPVFLPAPNVPLQPQNYPPQDKQNVRSLLQLKQAQQPTPPHSSQTGRLPSPHISHDQLGNHDSQVKIDFYEQRIKDLEAKLRTTQDLVSIFDSTGTSNNNHFGAQSINSLEYSLLGQTSHSLVPPLNKDKLPGFAELTSNGNNIVPKANNKRPLPVLIPGNQITNMNLLNNLVKKFFDRTRLSYLNDMFEEYEVLWFLNNHSKLDPWDHDDDMMVLLSILIDSLKETLLHPDRATIKDPKTTVRALVNYYFQVSKSQETESIKFMKSQVVLINYFYYCYEFEKSWKMMFSTVSNAYAHGIHIIQGPVWKNLSLLETVMCSLASRPNAIHGLIKINITQEEDPYREYELMNILRDRNMSYIEASIIGAEVKYQQVLQFDLRFENYNTCLTNLLNVEPAISQAKKLEHDRVYSLLMISLSEHLKLHFPYFENDRFSDLKTMELLILYSKVIVAFCRDQMGNLRDFLTCLECYIYQFLLIFIKYLNFKTVKSLLQPQNSYEIKSHKDDELSKLSLCQSQILQVFDSDTTYCEKRMLHVVDIVRSVKLAELNSDSFVSASGGKNAGYYANDSVKDVLESSNMLIALKDITELEPLFIFD